MAIKYVDINDVAHGGSDNGIGLMDGSDANNYMGWNQFLADFKTGNTYLFRGSRTIVTGVFDFSYFTINAWNLFLYGPWRLFCYGTSYFNLPNADIKNGVIKCGINSNDFKSIESMFLIQTAPYTSISTGGVKKSTLVSYNADPYGFVLINNYLYDSVIILTNHSKIAVIGGVGSTITTSGCITNASIGTSLIAGADIALKADTINGTILTYSLDPIIPEWDDSSIFNFNLINGYGVGYAGCWASQSVRGLWDSFRYGPGAFYFDPLSLNVDFSASPLIGGSPLSVSFTDLTTGSPPATNWLWDFGDSSPLSSVQNPVHVYTTYGTYNVSLSASNMFLSDAITKTSYIVVTKVVTKAGHIGAFYFGPEYANVFLDTAIIQVVGFEPQISAIIPVSADINISTALLTISGINPNVYKTSDIEINFSGIPLVGSSPLVVKFKSWITYKGKHANIYKVKEWKWYFDYKNHPTVYEKTTSDEILHVYSGYRGKTYFVKLEAVLEKI